MRTRFGSAPCLSILLIATMIGTLGRLGVVDRLDRLRHDAVVGRDHEHHDVGDLGAAGAHRGEGRVARRVEEGDRRAAVGRHLVGADVLGDAAGLAGDHVGLADRVEQRGLAVVDVAHDGDDRRARLQVRLVVLARGLTITSSTSESETRTTVWPNSSTISVGGVGVDASGSAVAIMPFCIRNLTTSAARSAMRLASSCTVIASGTARRARPSRARRLGSSALRFSRSWRRRIAARLRWRPSSSVARAMVSLPARRRSSSPLARARLSSAGAARSGVFLAPR